MDEPNTNQNNNNSVTEPNTNQTEPQVFSADYVKALRTENKNHRLTAKSYETALKGILGVDDLNDLDNKIQSFTAQQAKAISEATATANERLIKAELKAKTAGYDEKLLMKLIDMTKIAINEQGAITGIDEAIKAVEDEFPQVKKSTTPKPFVGTGTNSSGEALTGVEAAFLALNPGLKY